MGHGEAADQTVKIQRRAQRSVTVALAYTPYTLSHGAKAQANQGYEMMSFLKNTNQS